MKKLKLFVTLLICTFFLILTSRAVSFLFVNITDDNKKLPTQTFVADVNVSNMTKREAIVKVEKEVNKWKNKGLVINYNNKNMNPTKFIDFYIEDTIKSIDKSGQYQLKTKINGKDLILLVSKSVNIVNSKEKENKLIDEVYRLSSLLISKPINISALFNLTENNDLQLLNSSKTKLNTDVFNGYNKNINIKSNETFSFLDEFNSETLSNENLQQLAREIYKISLNTPLKIVERKINTKITNVEYLGYDTLILKGKSDLKLQNKTNQIITLEIMVENNILNTRFLMPESKFVYSHLFRNKKPIPRQKITESDATLNQGVTVQKEEGYDGFYVETYREIRSKDGKITRVELIAKDFYAPKNKYIRYGIKKVQTKADAVPSSISVWGATDNNK